MAQIGGQKSSMIPIAFLLLVPFPDEPTPQPAPKVSQSVIGLFSYDDYPNEALQAGAEGTVVVDLIIRTDGRPRLCRIVRSSGHQSLDLATCNIMLTRARFTPAKDSNGNPVEDTFRSPPVSWRIVQETEPKPEPLPK
jgi:protein TonB